MNKSYSPFIFIGGMFWGMVVILVIILITHSDPKNQLKRDRQEAVNQGYAQWVATTNGNVEFKWNNQLDNRK